MCANSRIFAEIHHAKSGKHFLTATRKDNILVIQRKMTKRALVLVKRRNRKRYVELIEYRGYQRYKSYKPTAANIARVLALAGEIKNRCRRETAALERSPEG